MVNINYNLFMQNYTEPHYNRRVYGVGVTIVHKCDMQYLILINYMISTSFVYTHKFSIVYTLNKKKM